MPTSTNMRRVAADTLGAYLESQIPGLAGKIFTAAAGPETRAPCLALRLISRMFRFVPSDALEVYENATTDDGKVLVDIGLFTGLLTLQLYTTSPAEREQYEQLILDVFLSTVWSPGTLYLTTPAVTVGGYASLYQAPLKAYLEDFSWIDEMAFESKRYSFMDVELDFSALAKYDAHTIESLQIAFSNSNTAVTTISQIDPTSHLEIQADGTVERTTL